MRASAMPPHLFYKFNRTRQTHTCQQAQGGVLSQFRAVAPRTVATRASKKPIHWRVSTEDRSFQIKIFALRTRFKPIIYQYRSVINKGEFEHQLIPVLSCLEGNGSSQDIITQHQDRQGRYRLYIDVYKAYKISL